MSQKIEVIVQSILKDEGFKAGLRNLRGLEAEAKKTARAGRGLSNEFKTAGKLFGGGLLAGAILGFGRQAVTEFARVERSLNAVRSLMQALGIDAERELPRVRAALEDIALNGGGAIEETLPVFQQMLGTLRDVDAAMSSTRLAASIAESGLVDVRQAGQILANVMKGEVGEATAKLGIQFKATGDKARDKETVLRALYAQYGALTEQVDDTTDTLSEASAGFDTLTQTIGSKLASTLNATWDAISRGGNPLDALARAMSSIGPIAVKTFAQVVQGVGGVYAYLLSIQSDVQSLRFDGALERAREVAARFRADWQYTVDGANEELDKVWEGWGEQHGESYREGMEKAIEIAGKIGTNVDTSAQERARAAERAAKAEAEAFLDLQRAKAEALEEGSQERLKAELRLLDMQRERELENADLTEEAKRAIVEKYNLEKLALHAEYLQGIHDAGVAAAEQSDEFERARMERRLELEEELWKELASIAEEGTAEYYDAQLEALVEWYRQKQAEARGDEEALEKIRKVFNARLGKLNKDRQKDEKETAESKAEAQRESVKEGIAALGVLFGQQKSAAIAMAIIDTYGAATKALNNPPGPPFTIPNMLLAIATGLAQVKQIRDTERGGGFDDPVNDAYARDFGGRKWARDLVDQVGLGFRSELGRLSLAIPQGALMGALAPAPVVSAGPTITENIRGGDVNLSRLMLADRRAMRRLSREVARASRLDSVRRLR